MSVTTCNNCGITYDQDNFVEHEEICREDGDTIELSSPQSDEVMIVDKKTYMEEMYA